MGFKLTKDEALVLESAIDMVLNTYPSMEVLVGIQKKLKDCMKENENGRSKNRSSRQR